MATFKENFVWVIFGEIKCNIKLYGVGIFFCKNYNNNLKMYFL